MKTRTLLLWSLACGVAIMLAGAVLLVQLVGQDDVPPPIAIGSEVMVGDMRVAVEQATEADGRLDVTLRLGGVDDPDPSDAFRLIAGGRAVRPGTADGDDCAATVAATTCVLTFDVSDADGSSRVLFYERGDERARWDLA